MAFKIVTHRWRPSRRTVRHVYGGPAAALRRRRRLEWIFWLAVLAAAMILAQVVR